MTTNGTVGYDDGEDTYEAEEELGYQTVTVTKSITVPMPTPVAVKPPSDPKKRSFVTLLTGEQYFKGVLALAYSFVEADSKDPLLVLVHKSISVEHVQQLRAIGCDIQIIELLQAPDKLAGNVMRWKFAFIK
eukprot:Colp12_sorted_trinity150504_noHs@3576